MTLLQSIGRQIRTLRLAEGLNQSGLANRMGTSRAYISGVETGKEALSLEQVERFAAALNATAEIILAAKASE